MAKPFELIVFDWDGTLMDSAARISDSLKAAGEELDLEELEDTTRRNVIGLGMREAIFKLYPDLTEVQITRFTDSYRHHFLFACPTPATLFDGVHPILQELGNTGTRLGVATGKSRKGLDRALEETDCGVYFHATRTADETRSKPDPTMLLEIIEELGASPDKTLMVGDTEYDLEMAQRAGTMSLAVTYGAHESHRLDKYKPLDSLDSISELHQWLSANV